MSFEVIFLFALLFVTIALFVSEKLRLDVVALMVIAVLMLSGMLTPREALAGFGDPVVFLIAALFVIGEALYRTGIANKTGNWLLKVGGDGETRIILLLMVVVAVLSAFMSSTGAVAIFIPVALTLAKKINLSPSKLLMPMAIASLIGGMLTLIGTPPNIVVSTQLERAGLEPFSFFDFTPAGAIVLAIGVVYILGIGRYLLPKHKVDSSQQDKSMQDLVDQYNKQEQLVMFHLEEKDEFCGQNIEELKLRRDQGLIVVGIQRKKRVGKEIIPVLSNTVFKSGDTVFAIKEGDVAEQGQKLALHPVPEATRQQLIEILGLAEVMLSPNSSLLGKTIKECQFRNRFNLHVIAINREDNTMAASPLDTPLAFGDKLLLGGDWQQIQALMNQKEDLLMLSLPAEFKDAVPQASKGPLAIGILVLMLLALTFKLVATETAVLVTALAFGATGCINMTQAYRAINWQSLVLIAGMLPMATALQKTGAIELIVQQLVSALGDAGPHMIMAALFVITSVFSQFISNTATAVLVAPIATGIATSLGISPYPLVMIVAIAASTAFSTPVASPVNTLILGPGKYKFGDFAKVGVPLQVIILAVSVFILPWLFPF